MSRRAGAVALATGLAFEVANSWASAAITGYDDGLAPTILLFAFPVPAMFVFGYRTVWRTVAIKGATTGSVTGEGVSRWVWVAIVAGGILGTGTGRLVASTVGLRQALSILDLGLFSLVGSIFLLFGALAGAGLANAVADHNLPDSRFLLWFGLLWLVIAAVESVRAAATEQAMHEPVLFLFLGWHLLAVWTIVSTRR